MGKFRGRGLYKLAQNEPQDGNKARPGSAMVCFCKVPRNQPQLTCSHELRAYQQTQRNVPSGVPGVHNTPPCSAVCTCVHMHVRVYMCAEARGQHWSVSSSVGLQLIFLRQGLALSWKLPDSVQLAGQRTWEVP